MSNTNKYNSNKNARVKRHLRHLTRLRACKERRPLLLQRPEGLPRPRLCAPKPTSAPSSAPTPAGTFLEGSVGGGER